MSRVLRCHDGVADLSTEFVGGHVLDPAVRAHREDDHVRERREQQDAQHLALAGFVQIDARPLRPGAATPSTRTEGDRQQTGDEQQGEGAVGHQPDIVVGNQPQHVQAEQDEKQERAGRGQCQAEQGQWVPERGEEQTHLRGCPSGPLNSACRRRPPRGLRLTATGTPA